MTRRGSGISRRREGFRERVQKYRVYAHDTERGEFGTQRILHGADPSLPCGGTCAPLNLRDWHNGRQPIKAEKRIGKAAGAFVTTPHCPPQEPDLKIPFAKTFSRMEQANSEEEGSYSFNFLKNGKQSVWWFLCPHRVQCTCLK